jgi:hypothetical protein
LSFFRFFLAGHCGSTWLPALHRRIAEWQCQKVDKTELESLNPRFFYHLHYLPDSFLDGKSLHYLQRCVHSLTAKHHRPLGSAADCSFVERQPSNKTWKEQMLP